MMNFQSLVERKLTPVGKSGSDIIYVCPRCSDSSGHLWVNYSTNKFHCFRCDWGSRSLISLLIELGIDAKFDYESLETSYSSGLEDVLSLDAPMKSKIVVDYSRNLKTLTEYYNLHTTSLTPIARSYLHNRGLTDSTIESLGMREGLNNTGRTLSINSKNYQGRDYSGRIMVPSIQKDGTIAYFVARDYTGMKNPKYLNPPKELAYSSEDVYNLDMVDSDYVIICEGAFSAIAVMSALQKNVAVATYGKSIAAKSNSDNPMISVTCQGEKLLSKKFKTYYVFYDFDARDSAIKTCKYLYDRGAFVKIVTIDTDQYGTHADANDLTKEELIQCILNAKVYDPFIEIDGLFT